MTPVPVDALLGAMSDIVLVLDRKGRYLWAAPTQAAGLGPKRDWVRWITGKAIPDVFPHREEQARLLAVLKRAIDTGEAQEIEYSTDADIWGSEIWFSAVVSPLDDDRVVWVARDVTGRVEGLRRLEERVEDRTRELSALLEVSRAVASTLDTRALMSTILDQLNTIIDHTGSSILKLVDGGLEFVAARSVAGHERPTGVRLPLDEPITSLWEAIRSGEAVIIDDVRSDEPMAIDYRNLVSAAGLLELPPFQVLRSWIAVPLTLKDQVTGMLSISHTVPASFTLEHARLARAFADQAAIAIENARLFEETDRGKRELGALLQTSHALASTLELKPLLERILEELRHFVDYAGASVNLLRDGMLHQLAVRRPRGPAVTSSDTARAIPSDTFERVGVNIQAGDPLLIYDVHDDSAEALLYRDMYGGTIKGTAVEYIRSFMNLPLLARGEVVGVLSMAHEQPGFFRQEHAALLRPLAAQAALAIENARLFAETQARGRETEALFRADAELFRSLDLDTVLQALVDVTVDIVGADKSLVSTWEGVANRITIRAARNMAPESLHRIAGYSDALGLPDRYPEVTIIQGSAADLPLIQSIFRAESIHCFVDVPITSSSGELLGSFSVAYVDAHSFTPDEMRLLVALAERAAVAINNAELYQRAQLAASLEERQRLARELHDSVSQALYGIALGARTARTLLDRDAAEAVEPVDYILSLAEAGLTEMRALIFELRPESLETEGLVAAIAKQAAALEARYGLAVECRLGAEPQASLPVKEALYRITQEALNNTVKHAKATVASVVIEADDHEAAVTVRDNGAGFDPDGEFPGHLGLRSMKERAEKSGGSVSIASASGAGTVVRATFPLPATAA